MLFDVNPKERREDLYDRDAELAEVLRAIGLGERLVVVYGVRRVGKTSLVRVAVGEAGVPFVLVDVKGMYFEEGAVRRESLYRAIAREFSRNADNSLSLSFNFSVITCSKLLTTSLTSSSFSISLKWLDSIFLR